MKRPTVTRAALCAALTLATIVASTRSADAQSRATDGVRFRGGFSLGAGPYLPFATSNTASAGGAGGLTIRLGAQINHHFGVYVQSQNLVGVITGQSTAGALSGALMGHSQNALMASVIVLHTLELAAGPSFDLLAFGNCDSATLACGSGVETALGGHARAAVMLGGWAPTTARRFGLSLSADLHPTKYVGQNGGLVALVFGLGLDWF